MQSKKFPLSSFSPTLQKMCRLPYKAPSFVNKMEPVDYLERFSLTDEDIPALLEIAVWYGREADMDECWDAPFHAWSALAMLDPKKIVPRALEMLNHINWENMDGFHDEIYCSLSCLAMKETDMIPLLLNAIKENERHEETRSVILEAVWQAVEKIPLYKQQLHEILIEQLSESRIDSRGWYASIVCNLAFVENMTPELAELLRKVCLSGLVNIRRIACNDGLKEQVGVDFEKDPALKYIYDEFETIDQILWDFKRCDRTFPKPAVLQAREYKERIIPSLIEIIRNATAYARFGISNDNGPTLFAVHLLAEFQAKEALPAIFDSLSLTIDEIWKHLYGEGYYESLPGILGRLIGDTLEFYDQKIRDPQTPCALQCCLSRALKYLVARKVISEEAYTDLLRDYLEIAIRFERKEFVTNLICDILYTANPDFLPLVQRAYEKELVDENWIPKDDAECYLEIGGVSIEKMFPNPNRDFSDTITEFGSWVCFRETSYPVRPQSVIDVSQHVPDDALYLSPKNLFPQIRPQGSVSATIRNTEPQAGRNDPCPCGSGKKYKKCCLKK